MDIVKIIFVGSVKSLVDTEISKLMSMNQHHGIKFPQ